MVLYLLLAVGHTFTLCTFSFSLSTSGRLAKCGFPLFRYTSAFLFLIILLELVHSPSSIASLAWTAQTLAAAHLNRNLARDQLLRKLLSILLSEFQ